MKIIVTKNEITKAVRRVIGVSPKTSTLPILTTLLFAANKEGSVALTATNLEMVAHATASADVHSEGGACIPALKFSEIIKELSDGDIEMRLEGDNLKVNAGRASYTINTLPSSGFPAIENGTGASFTMSAEVFSTLISRSAFAAATEKEASPIMKSVLFKGNGSLALMIATDGHRLSLSQAEVSGFKGMALIPRDAMEEIDRFISEESGDVIVSVDPKFIRVSLPDGSATFRARLIEGEYVAYSSVVESVRSKGVNRITANREELLSALKRVTILCGEKSRQTQLSSKGNSLWLDVADANIGNGFDEVSIESSGDKLLAGLNGQYLMEGIKALPAGGRVVISFSTADKEGMRSPLLLSTEGVKSTLQLISPMRLENVVRRDEEKQEELKEAA